MDTADRKELLDIVDTVDPKELLDIAATPVYQGTVGIQALKVRLVILATVLLVGIVVTLVQ